MHCFIDGASSAFSVTRSQHKTKHGTSRIIAPKPIKKNRQYSIRKPPCYFRSHPEISVAASVMACIMQQLWSPCCKAQIPFHFSHLDFPCDFQLPKKHTSFCLHKFDYCRSARWVGERCLNIRWWWGRWASLTWLCCVSCTVHLQVFLLRCPSAFSEPPVCFNGGMSGSVIHYSVHGLRMNKGHV